MCASSAFFRTGHQGLFVSIWRHLGRTEAWSPMCFELNATCETQPGGADVERVCCVVEADRV